MLGWKPFYLQSLRAYDPKTTDSHKIIILNSLRNLMFNENFVRVNLS